MSWWKTRFARAPGFSLGSGRAGGGRWSPPDPPCGRERCCLWSCVWGGSGNGIAGNIWAGKKCCSVFRGGPPALLCEMWVRACPGQPALQRRQRRKLLLFLCQAKPSHPLSNRPEIRQPWLSSGVFPTAVDAACWEMLVGMTNHLEKLLWWRKGLKTWAQFRFLSTSLCLPSPVVKTPGVGRESSVKLGNSDSVIPKALGFLCCPADHRAGTVTSFFLPFSPVPGRLRVVLLEGRWALQP